MYKYLLHHTVYDVLDEIIILSMVVIKEKKGDVHFKLYILDKHVIRSDSSQGGFQYNTAGDHAPVKLLCGSGGHRQRVGTAGGSQ